MYFNKYYFILLFLFSYIRTFTRDNPIILTSIPKTGKHLTSKLINILTGKDNFYTYKFDLIKHNYKTYFFSNHLRYSTNNIKMLNNAIKGLGTPIKFFLIRDPRDQLISFIFWALREMKERRGLFLRIEKNPEKYKEILPNYFLYKNLSFDQLIFKLIYEGSAYYDGQGPYLGKNHVTKGITEFYNSYLPWIKTPGVCLVKFENLVGVNGGGSQSDQINEIKKIAKHLQIQLEDTQITKITHKLFGNTLTFREGKIGSWKKYFKPEHKQAFKKVAGQLLIKLGYEKNLDW